MRRHALRLGVTIAAAATIALLVGDASTFTARSSWMLLGAFIALQPQPAATRDAAVQRAIGTVVGAGVTIALVSVMPHTIWIGWIFLLLAFVSFGLRSVNYAWYCVALTPIVVLGFAGGPLDYRILAARVTWTAAGVMLAVIARNVLWTREADVSIAVAA